MSRPININETLTFAPTSNTSTTNLTASSSYPASNGYTDASSTTYTRFSITTSTTGSTYYVFSVSGIPSGATISSVSCVAKIRINSTTYVTNTQIQLYSGTTAKGTSRTFASTSASNTVTLNGGTWTVAELENARLYFRGTGNNSNNNKYIYFYGATLTVVYSLQGTEYEITSTLATDAVDSIDPAGQTYVIDGGEYELNIYTDDISNITVEDNGNDVTSSLVHVQGINNTSTYNPSTFDTTNSSISGTNTTNGCAAETTSTTATFSASTSGTTSIYYNFDCSNIPDSVEITNISVTLRCSWPGGNGTNNTGTTYFTSRMVYLCNGTTKKGSGATITNTTSSQTATQTVTNNGTWTREELNNIKLLFEGVHTTGNTQAVTVTFWGATLSVTYKIDEHYKYTLSNVNTDHTIIIANTVIEIPEEDPQYDYYPITISSINATTEPGRGTTRVIEGTSQTIIIYPDDPSIALVTDNGVDITSQLVQHGSTIPNPTVATVSGASYGFNLNSNTGYYVSQNAGVSNSAAVCRVTFNLPVRCLITIQFINYAESPNYDYGIFGNIDTALVTTNTADSNVKLSCAASTYNLSTPQTLTYEIPSGEHFIDIKYRKDPATDSYNDNLQWKILSIEPLESNNYYTYTLSNIQEAHSLIFIFGDVTYYFVNTDGTGAKLFPSGSMVQLPGDYYTLTIVPDDYSYNVTVTDNNTDVTSQVQRKEEEITKEGNTYTVVNYIYKLNNIQATHNIVVQCSGTNSLYIKINGSWVQATHVYIKQNNVWTEVQDYSTLFDDPNEIYVTGQ